MRLGFPALCPKCHVRVNCEAGAAGGVPGNELNCCKCVPRRLQVSLIDSGGYTAYCKTFAIDCETGRWGGFFLINGDTVDFELYFATDDAGVCWFWLESAFLNLEIASSDTRLQEVMPGDWSTYRTTRIASCENPEFTFDGIVIPGYDTVTLTTTIADYQTVNPENLKRCDTYDCVDGITCTDCHCWCRCVCITYVDDGENTVSRVCWDEYTESWQFTGGGETLSISIGCDTVTGESQLVLSDPFNGVTRSVAANCPEVSGSWGFTKPDTTSVSVSITCDTCGECTGGTPDTCGCYDPIAATLYATFEPGTDPGGPDPNPNPCTGATGTITLRWDDASGAWLGFGTPFSGCSTVVYLRMTCAGSGQMQLELGTSWAALNDMGTNAITCDPFDGSWTGLTPLLATDACCGVVGTTIDYHILNIHITE